MKMNNIIIDDELKKYMRPLRDEEYEKLKESVLSEGIRDPLVTWNGRLLDGYHRYKIAQEYNLEYKTIDINLPDKEAAKEWMIINQLGRRNLTPQEASYYRGKLYESKKRQGARTDLTSGQNVQKLSTAEEIGKQYGVDEKTIRRDAEFSKVVDKITEEVGEEAKRAILSGQANIPKKDIEKLIEIKQKAPELVKPVLQGEVPLQRAKLEVQKKIAASIPKPAPPEGKYSVIYADPPWQYSNSGFTTSAANQYLTMPTQEICNLPIGELANDNAVLFLWATSPMLKDALRVCEAWGFDYKTNFVWIKNHHTGGFYCYGQHELLFIATKGSMLPNTNGLRSSVISAPRREHSRKPDEVYDIIEAMYDGPYIELFARTKREGWAGWGIDYGIF